MHQSLLNANEKIKDASLFREKEVDNLSQLIYNSKTEEIPDGSIVDTNRYDVSPTKLEVFRSPALKKILKSKFVTGQSQD